MVSLISDLSTPARDTTASRTAVPRSWAGVVANAPPNDPTAVRAADAITTLVMSASNKLYQTGSLRVSGPQGTLRRFDALLWSYRKQCGSATAEIRPRPNARPSLGCDSRMSGQAGASPS